MKTDEGQATSSQGQEVEDTETEKGSVYIGTASTQLKCPHIIERAGPRKKGKPSNFSIDPITLTKGDLHDIEEMVCVVTNEALQDFM